MLNYLKLLSVFIILSFYKVNGLSKSYSAGGISSVVNSNGFTIRQDYNRLYCGTLVCNDAVNCEILKHGSNVNEKCMDINRRIIDQKSYPDSSYSGDVELYFGPAYAREAEEQSRRINDQVHRQIQNSFDNVFPNLNNGNTYPFNNPNNYNPNNNYPNNNYPNNNYANNNYPNNNYPNGNNYYNDYDRRYWNTGVSFGKSISYISILVLALLTYFAC